MKNDVFLTLEKRDLEIKDELEFSLDSRWMEAVISTYFDVNKKFGLNTYSGDGVWVDLLAKYNPFDDELKVECNISTADSSFVREYKPTAAETKMMTMLIEEACINQMKTNCRDALIRNFMEEAQKINLVCVKTSVNEYKLKNIWGNYVVYTEDRTGKLKDHIGHSIEYVKYGTEDNYSFSIECTDCDEVLLAQTEDPNELITYEEGVYEYGEYRIIVSPDYKKAIEIGDAPDQMYCKVYAKTDAEFKNCLGEFNMMEGYEYNEITVESIEEGIDKLMEESMSFYELQRRETEFNRADELLARSVSYIAELSGTENLREILIEKLDMTEDEANSIVESIEPEIEAEQGMTLG